MSRFVTSRSLTDLPERLLRAVLGVLVCTLALSMTVAGAPTAAGADRLALSGVTLKQAVVAEPQGEAPPAVHSDGAALDLDEGSSEGRLVSAATTLTERLFESSGLNEAADDDPCGVGVPLPERPPRA